MAKLKAAWNGRPCPPEAKAIVDQIRNAQAASAAKARGASKVKSKTKLHVGAKTKLPLPTTLPSRDALRKQVTLLLYVSVQSHHDHAACCSPSCICQRTTFNPARMCKPSQTNDPLQE